MSFIFIVVLWIRKHLTPKDVAAVKGLRLIINFGRKGVISEIDCEQTAMDLPPVKSAIFLIIINLLMSLLLELRPSLWIAHNNIPHS
jgi:hypothetical protein